MLHVYWQFTLSTLRNYPTTCNPDRAKKKQVLERSTRALPWEHEPALLLLQKQIRPHRSWINMSPKFLVLFSMLLISCSFPGLVGAMRQQWEDSVCTVNLPCVMKVLPVGLKIQTSALQILCCVRGELWLINYVYRTVDAASKCVVLQCLSCRQEVKWRSVQGLEL